MEQLIVHPDGSTERVDPDWQSLMDLMLAAGIAAGREAKEDEAA